MQQINLGDRVRDRISGIVGIAIARTEWLYGCVRISIQPEKAEKDKPNKPAENFTVDEPQCEVLKAAALTPQPFWRVEGNAEPRRAAGPQPRPERQPDPSPR